MRKKWLSLALALVMCLSLMPSAFAAESGGGVEKFTDVPADAWYREELDYAVRNGYISGTSASTFSPSANLSRSQFVTILGRMLNVDTSLYTSSKFEDVNASSWYGPYVAWAADKGYVNGTSSTTFSPDSNLTTEQMGVVMSNYISKSGVVLTPSSTFTGYADAANISGWAKSGMDVMAQYDLLPVDGKGNVSPRKAATRAEAAVSLVRLAQSAGWGTAPAIEKTQNDEGSYTWDDVEAKVKAIHDELWATGQITNRMTEKEKAIAYFRWMCVNCEYHTEWDKGVSLGVTRSAYGPLLYGYGVCSGLSQAYYLLVSSEGISCTIVDDYEANHAWNVATLDGAEYKIDLTEGVLRTKWADGSLSEVLFKENVQKQFYPDEWQAEQDKNSGFTKPTEEELQQMLDSWQ